MIWIASIAIVFLAARLAVVAANLFTPVVLPYYPKHGERPLVSVLIPARNEAATIGDLLDSLLLQDYQHIEVFVYDDLSTDATPQIVRDFAAKDNRIRYIPGHALPKGWLGKNHACWQLAKQASGKYLLFLDADVHVSNSLISDALNHLQRHNLHLLSLFPKQEMKTFSEKITIPVMNWILLSLLPLILTRKSTRPALAAANGQFMLFRADTYHQRQWHWQVKQHRVEDIVIARRMKKAGLPIQTLVPDNQISCRMYTGFDDAVKGFAKNLPEFFGNSWLWLLFVLFFTTAGFLFVGIAFSWLHGLLYLLVAVLLRGAVAGLSRQPVFQVMLLAPCQQFSFLWITAKAAYFVLKPRNTWKGRQI